MELLGTRSRARAAFSAGFGCESGADQEILDSNDID